ncbi:hypothetical protein [Ectopseudomonas khazarica]|uniref:hypothetical protein n=1 Tax=Ectopseudomonas khazarica TaxID=2502979 RepID=UPI003B95B723
MTKPHHPKLPLCCALAAHNERYQFAHTLSAVIAAASYDERKAELHRLSGLLAAYLEFDLITREQHSALRTELREFVFGASA